MLSVMMVYSLCNDNIIMLEVQTNIASLCGCNDGQAGVSGTVLQEERHHSKGTIRIGGSIKSSTLTLIQEMLLNI